MKRAKLKTREKGNKQIQNRKTEQRKKQRENAKAEKNREQGTRKTE